MFSSIKLIIFVTFGFIT